MSSIKDDEALYKNFKKSLNTGAVPVPGRGAQRGALRALRAPPHHAR